MSVRANQIAIVILVVISSVFLTSKGFAARSGTVDIADAPFFEKPDRNLDPVEKLKKNTPIAASNLPVNGFFKVRTLSGKIGWMKQEDLSLQPAPPLENMENEPSEEKLSPKGSRSQPRAKPLPTPAYDKDTKPRHRVYLKGLGDLNFFNAAGIIGGYDTFGKGYSFGGELVLMLSKRFGLVLRVEKISKAIALQDTGTSKSFLVELASMPITGGIEYTLFQGSRFSGHIAVLAGSTLQTSITSTSLSDTSDNVTQVTSREVTGLGKLDIQFELFKSLSLFAEGGYRYLQSPLLTLSNPNANGSAVLNSTFVVNLTGPFVGGGASLNF